MTKRTAKPAKAPDGTERLQKFMAHCGIASRRGAEELITQGRVEINGVVANELGCRVDPQRDEVRVDGERLAPQRQRLVLVLNKPVGFLCARSDPEGRPQVYQLMPDEPSLRTVGRLDFNTEGVLLVTNDGDLAERLGHARYSILRTYEARVRGVPTAEVLAALTRGVRLEDGPARAENAELIKSTDANAWVRLTLTEGRNREVRRLMERVGHPVVRLRRISFAGVTAAGLRPGEWRMLSDSEIHQLETRGHVGGFEMPPDPRKRSVERRGISREPSSDKPANSRVKPSTGRADTRAKPAARPPARPAPRSAAKTDDARARPRPPQARKPASPRPTRSTQGRAAPAPASRPARAGAGASTSRPAPRRPAQTTGPKPARTARPPRKPR